MTDVDSRELLGLEKRIEELRQSREKLKALLFTYHYGAPREPTPEEQEWLRVFREASEELRKLRAAADVHRG